MRGHQSRRGSEAPDPGPPRAGPPRRSRLALMRCTACWSFWAAWRSTGSAIASIDSISGTRLAVPNLVPRPPAGLAPSPPADTPAAPPLVGLGVIGWKSLAAASLGLSEGTPEPFAGLSGEGLAAMPVPSPGWPGSEAGWVEFPGGLFFALPAAVPRPSSPLGPGLSVGSPPGAKLVPFFPRTVRGSPPLCWPVDPLLPLGAPGCWAPAPGCFPWEEPEPDCPLPSSPLSGC
jgi:hypothetical protein